MRKFPVFIGTALFLMTNVFAIGSQHGVFRSQSTQGAAWQGTAVITEEHFDMTVYPDYLDVELEWTFTVGGTPPAAYQDALEIVGNLNLEANAVVVGMITWYKGMVLKGKLKTEEVARENYETVVDRSATRPPPPRDPVLIEYGWGRDNYDISIFPAAFGGTRTVRMRYLVPAFNSSGVNRISFPNAFTGNATVRIRKGPGVAGYAVETGNSRKQFDLASPLQLDAKEYSFQAWGGNGGKSITTIIPILSSGTPGSTFYAGAFSTDSFSGEMLHVALATPETALLQAPVAEDYVILWRWNHPNILARYARQIVEQSQLLKMFLSELQSADKRAALIISKEGGETITFRLDRQGGREFARMVRYLDDLAEQAIVDPPMTSTRKTPEIQCDTSAMRQEFEDALRQAMALFKKNAGSLRHLLILTAGPQLVYSSAAKQVYEWDSTVDVSLLTVYMSGRKPGDQCVQTTDVQYWPGVDMAGFVSGHRADWTVTATVGSGADSVAIAALSPPAATGGGSCWKLTTEAHLYSALPIRKEIRWNITLGDRPVASFTETPRVVSLDGMQYARLIGASHYLVPLARTMPSSMASTLGFIDEKYSLVALEEDALPAAVGRSYDSSGVPLLDQADITASAAERWDVPVSEWLVAHPPESLCRNIYPVYPTINIFPPVHGWQIRDTIMLRMVMFDAINVVQAVEADPDVPVRIGVPQVEAWYPSTAAAYPDYSAALVTAHERPTAKAISTVRPFVHNGFLTIDLQTAGIGPGNRISVVLYDFAGRIVFRWSGTATNSEGRLQLPCRGLARGVYLLNVCGGAVTYHRNLVIR